MALTRSDVEALMKGIAPALNDQISKAVQPLADLITEQRRDIARLEKRVAILDGGTTGKTIDGHAMRSIEGAGQ